MIRQGEEVKVGKKCGGFVLPIEGVSTAHRLLKGMCTASENWRVVPSSAGAGSVNLRVQVTRFLLDRVCVFARSGMVWGARLPSAARRRAFAICSAWCLIMAGGVKRELQLIQRV